MADSLDDSIGSDPPAFARSTVSRHAECIANVLLEQLLRLEDIHLCAVVLDSVFRNEHVRPLLPHYYPSP
jgi:hypothetical protein